MNSFADFFWAMIVIYFWVMVIWIFIRLFADIFRRRDLSGVMKVVWILVLFWIPFLGAMIYIIARPKDAPGDIFPSPAPAPAQAQPTPVASSSADEIAKLAALRDAGTITPAEFDAAKAKALAE